MGLEQKPPNNEKYKLMLFCVTYCKPTYFRGYYVSRFPASRQFRRDLISR